MGKRDKHLRRSTRKPAAPIRQRDNFPARQTGTPAEQAPVPWQERALLVLFWGYVLLPLAWGVAATVQKALLLFK